MSARGTLQDQELLAKSKNFCMQNGARSEAISQKEKQSEHGLERLPVGTP
jgi:hypothetical protein